MINFCPGSEGTVLKDLTMSYGEKSRYKAKDGELKISMGPARIHVFEIDTPNIEKDRKGHVMEKITFISSRASISVIISLGY